MDHQDPPGIQDLWSVPLFFVSLSLTKFYFPLFAQHKETQMTHSLFFFVFHSHFASQGEQGSDGAVGKDVSDVICSLPHYPPPIKYNKS